MPADPYHEPSKLALDLLLVWAGSLGIVLAAFMVALLAWAAYPEE